MRRNGHNLDQERGAVATNIRLIGVKFGALSFVSKSINWLAEPSKKSPMRFVPELQASIMASSGAS